MENEIERITEKLELSDYFLEVREQSSIKDPHFHLLMSLESMLSFHTGIDLAKGKALDEGERYIRRYIMKDGGSLDLIRDSRIYSLQFNGCPKAIYDDVRANIRQRTAELIIYNPPSRVKYY